MRRGWLITRPAEDAAELTAKLAAHGLSAAAAPFLDISARPDPGVTVDDMAALAFTSANGVRAFAAAWAGRDLPVFAVGEATARAARRAGFGQVTAAGSSARDLAALIRRLHPPGAGPVLFGSGAQVRVDLAALLRAEGYDARRIILYDADPPAGFPARARTALADPGLAGVLFFSPRTAGIFEASLPPDLALIPARLTAGCLSPAVAKALAMDRWNAVIVAPRPETEALIGAIMAASAADPEAPSPKFVPRPARGFNR